jgi:hypothetical protein
MFSFLLALTYFSCRYPTILMFYNYAAADINRVRGRPNFFLSTQKQAVEVFAKFKSLTLMPNASSCE